MTTIREFIEAAGITVEVEPADGNPYVDGPGFNHYRVTLTRGDRFMEVTYSMGPAHTEGPKVDDVLDTLASDASGYENADGDFRTWCAEYGYDNDSIKASETFDAVRQQSNDLRALLGDVEYSTLLWETERE